MNGIPAILFVHARVTFCAEATKAWVLESAVDMFDTQVCDACTRVCVRASLTVACVVRMCTSALRLLWTRPKHRCDGFAHTRCACANCTSSRMAVTGEHLRTQCDITPPDIADYHGLPSWVQEQARSIPLGLHFNHVLQESN